MTTIDLQQFIGRKALLPFGPTNEVMIEVVVVNVKETWGRVRYQIRPVAGFGVIWVEKLNFVNIRATIPEVKDSIGD